MIIGVPDFLYCCIILIMVLCHGRSPIKKIKKQSTGNKKCQKQKINSKRKKENIYISNSNELMDIIALILIHGEHPYSDIFASDMTFSYTT